MSIKNASVWPTLNSLFLVTRDILRVQNSPKCFCGWGIALAPLFELTKLPTLSSRLGRGKLIFAPVLAIVLGQKYTLAPVFFWSPYLFINNYLDSFLLELCYYGIYLLSYTSSWTVTQITDVKIQLQKSKILVNLVQNMHGGILKTIATSGFLTASECTKFVFGRGYAAVR